MHELLILLSDKNVTSISLQSDTCLSTKLLSILLINVRYSTTQINTYIYLYIYYDSFIIYL